MMNPLFILAVGMVVVIGGILGLRLHAFLALLSGAFAVAFLTSPEAIYGWAVGTGLGEVEALVEAALEPKKPEAQRKRSRQNAPLCCALFKLGSYKK